MKQQYRPAKSRANWATFFLAVFGLIAIASIISTIAEIGLLQRINSGEFVSDAEAVSNDNRQRAIGLLYSTAFVAAAIAFLVWIRRASDNLARLGVREQRFSPGWAVGWWFIPFAWLFRPYQVMKEIWKGSYPEIDAKNPDAWTDSPTSRLLGPWWGAWLLSLWAANSLSVLFSSDATVSDLIVSGYRSVASDAIGTVALVLVVILMRRITSNQDKKHLVYQTLIEEGAITEGEVTETAQGPNPPVSAGNLAPPAQPSQNPRCPKCRNAMAAQDLAYGICHRCRSSSAF